MSVPADVRGWRSGAVTTSHRGCDEAVMSDPGFRRRTSRQLAEANEYARRAELQRRAMMTPDQRSAYDHVMEVETIYNTGVTQANLRAFTVVMVGLIATFVAMASPAPWLALPVLALTVWGAYVRRRSRMRVVEGQLAVLEAPPEHDVH